MSIIEKAVGSLSTLKDSDLNEEANKKAEIQQQDSVAEKTVKAIEQKEAESGCEQPASTDATQGIQSDRAVEPEAKGVGPKSLTTGRPLIRNESGRDRVKDDVPAPGSTPPPVPKASERPSKAPSITIPLEILQEKGMVTHAAPRSVIAEEYRIIKRPLLMNISGKGAAEVEHPNLIMVTSCLQGEGKTFSALNLAMSMSLEKDKTVLFIDGDIAKASAGRLLGVPDTAPGLIDILEGKGVGIEDVLVHTDVPNLKIMPAGQIHEHSTELLASQKMLRLANEISERYPDRIIIFDSPPLLLTTEARVLANAMGQILFVVAAEHTANDALHEALSYLSEDKIIGMVLNKAKRNLWAKHRYAYGYGYGYGYGEGSSRERKSELEANAETGNA